ncbi:MAG: ATP-binding protein [Gemmiger sp.]|nr:ATP-binding protein [Gemmiger sp.]
MGCKTLSAHLHGLVVFRGILQDPVVARFGRMLDVASAPAPHAIPFVEAAAEFTAALFEAGADWTAYLLDVILQNENICIRKAASGGAGALPQSCLAAELKFLQALGTTGLDDILKECPPALQAEAAFLPRWQVSTADFAARYAERCALVAKKGYGLFAQYHVFTVEDGALTPVKFPDPQRLSELPGYEKERERILLNTKALLAGLPANNVLLYGDAGTGKSSTVKAVANEFAPEGLRLVEVKKNQLYQLPALMDSLAQNPLKFILFIDDLSFTANDDNFAALKAILEGSVGGRSQNVVVYATSNRRHLIKETLTDRAGDDIHEGDTRQELMSLSARFGLTITFLQPDKARFEGILLELARQYNVQLPSDQLYIKGEAFALRAGGRSPRVAKQFIELCKASVKF